MPPRPLALAFTILVVLVVLGAVGAAIRADEGMWTFDNFPIARANQALGTRIDQAWLDRVRLSSVRFGGCSAGIVSGDGLVLTNNHCVATCVANLSTPAANYAETGFTPRRRDEEVKCPGAVAEVLLSITDVTPRMHAAGGTLTGQAFTAARNAEAGRIESEACGRDATRRCIVVSLYRGGQFKLYVYRLYADVRLAFAPEDRTATFGGDPDNFNFPRFAVDAAFIRVYENGRPAATPTHFTWNASRPAEGQPVFVSGSPGATQRLLTADQLMTVRDVVLPLDQLIASELRGRLQQFSAQGEEQAFIAMDALGSLENTYKRGLGRMRALVDAAFMARRGREEAEFRSRVAADPALARRVGDPWADLAAIQPKQRELYPAYSLLEGRAGGGSMLFGWAMTLVRGAQERARPSDQRLPEFSDSRLAGVETRLLAQRPVHPALDQLQIEWWLSKTREWLTADDARVRTLVGRESPEATGRASRPGHDAGRCGRAADALAGRASGDRGVHRSVDSLCADHSGADAGRAARVGRDRGSADRSRVGAAGRRTLRGLRRQRVSRCHRHAASELRPRRGLGRAGPAVRAVHDVRRTLGAGDRRAAVRRGGEAFGGESADRSGDGHRHDGVVGHHRRQLRLAGHQRGGRDHRGELRLDGADAAQRLRLRSRREPEHHRDERGGDDGAARRLQHAVDRRGTGQPMTTVFRKRRPTRPPDSVDAAVLQSRPSA